MSLKQNIIYLYFKGKHLITSKSQYQYNHGQYLYFADLNLPQAFEVHFSNKDRGESKTQIGSNKLVEIPDEYFWNGALQIYAWVYLHDGTDDGETIYEVRIPLIKRAKPTDEEPLPIQQSAIDKAIAELNNAVDITNENADKTNADKTQVATIKEEVVTLKEEIDSTASAVSQDAQSARESADASEQSAQNSAESERKALDYSDEAKGYAQSALESKNIANQKSEIATNASSEAMGYRNEALEAKNQAVQAKQNIVDYRDETKGYRDETLTAKDDAQTIKGDVQSLKTQIDKTATDVETNALDAKSSADLSYRSAISADNASLSASQFADEASDFADSASQSANQAEQFKNQSATNVTHYPKVINGYWYVWDASNEVYVNTNVDARGIKGDKGDVGDTGNGIESTVLNSDYTLTITFTDGTSYTTPSIRGKQGEKGNQGEVGESGVYIGENEPSNEGIKVWIDTDESADSGGGAGLEKITYAELKAKRDGGQLTSGGQYRITDYTCTTIQEESRAVSHPFDIIVVADSASVLNENARACLHDGDDYYSAQDHQANLEAWQLKYCIDNDDNRFAWADTVNGKGVIYYMKDDRNNECPYDFKQIQFKRYPITECIKVPSLVGKYAALSYSEGITGIDEQNPVWCYTFSVRDWEATSVIYDGSIVPLSDDESGHGCFVLNNKISPLINYKDLEEGYGQKILYLNDIVFTGHWGNNCQSNTFDDNCSSNTFGDDCQSNTFGKGCYFNTFGDYCSSNTFGDDCQSNTFGDYCSYNTFGRSCYFNTFGDNCEYNTFAVNCQSNTFGDYCSYNTFGDYCGYNTFGDNCQSNTFDDNCNSNTFGDNCQSNTFDDGCYSNTFGDSCSSNTFDDNCYSNTFGDSCYSNTFGYNCGSNTFGHNCGYNTFGKNCMYVDLAAGESSMNTRQYYYVLDGVEGTQSSHISITGTSGNNFETYVGMNSSGVLKTWIPADLAT